MQTSSLTTFLARMVGIRLELERAAQVENRKYGGKRRRYPEKRDTLKVRTGNRYNPNECVRRQLEAAGWYRNKKGELARRRSKKS